VGKGPLREGEQVGSEKWWGMLRDAGGFRYCKGRKKKTARGDVVTGGIAGKTLKGKEGNNKKLTKANAQTTSENDKKGWRKKGTHSKGKGRRGLSGF